ncbi:hypothetical protein VKT23_005157 [Stygiomarasmius scandens]|uniref:Methyltransferase domain-containing protein n=1 Tax=Marasmiellus scandens TaxID=2682957 RepID=A0ABR1JSB6_9AGAR
MVSGEESAYVVLTQDDAERKRLNDAYHYYKESVRRGKFIYDESLVLPEDAAVLDVGTGSGAWISDMVQIVPSSVVIHGIDISPAFFPHIQSSANQNIRLSVHSCTSLPEDWSNSFDLVNQSLLIAAITQDEWRQNLRETYRVLKPGGQVQLFDPDFESLSSHPGTAYEKTRLILESLWAKHSLMFDFKAQIACILMEIGFKDILIEVKEGPIGKQKGDAGLEGADIQCRGLRSMQPIILRYSGFGIVNNSEEFESLLDTIQREWDEGTSWLDYVVVCARRPSTAV